MYILISLLIHFAVDLLCIFTQLVALSGMFAMFIAVLDQISINPTSFELDRQMRGMALPKIVLTSATRVRMPLVVACQALELLGALLMEHVPLAALVTMLALSTSVAMLLAPVALVALLMAAFVALTALATMLAASVSLRKEYRMFGVKMAQTVVATAEGCAIGACPALVNG